MTRRNHGPPRCQDCHRPFKWLKSPTSSAWRKFDPGTVNPRTHTGTPAYPREGLATYTFNALVEELMGRRECSRAEAQDEAYAFPWHPVHVCQPTTAGGDSDG
jgi:hypothetical protein